MKWIHLGYEYFACVDDEDFEKVKKFVWRNHPKMYARTHQVLGDKKDVFLHEFLMPERKHDQEIDHANRATWDNRKSNLRTIERWQNQQNKGIPIAAPYPSKEEMQEAIKQRKELKSSQNFLSVASKNNQNWRAREAKRVYRKVRDSNGNVFDSAVQAAKYYGGKHSSNILACIQGKKLSAYGQNWEYID